MRLPQLSGRPIRVELRRSLGPHLAATSIPRRVILLDSAVFSRPGDFERILAHEIFHFVWVRLSNQTRRRWEEILAAEIGLRAFGELGWSSEWRKKKLRASDRRRRTPAWRRYVCESFCDTAAWLFAHLRTHEEFTLATPARTLRRAWFVRNLLANEPVSI